MVTNTHTIKLTAPGWLLAGGVIALLVFIGCTRPVSTEENKAAQSDDATPAQTVSIPVEGMSCASCAASVKRTAEALNGVRVAEVDLAKRRARIEYIEAKTSPEQIAAAIEELGYKTGSPIAE